LFGKLGLPEPEQLLCNPREVCQNPCKKYGKNFMTSNHDQPQCEKMTDFLQQTFLRLCFGSSQRKMEEKATLTMSLNLHVQCSPASSPRNFTAFEKNAARV
jgi:hypothetical protein